MSLLDQAFGAIKKKGMEDLKKSVGESGVTRDERTGKEMRVSVQLQIHKPEHFFKEILAGGDSYKRPKITIEEDGYHVVYKGPPGESVEVATRKALAELHKKMGL